MHSQRSISDLPHSHAPEVDLLVAILTQALEDAVHGVRDLEKNRPSRHLAESHARFFIFSEADDWADSRKLILSMLDVDDSYFRRLARRYIEGRQNGTLSGLRRGMSGRTSPTDRAYRAASLKQMARPERPKALENLPRLPSKGPLAARVLAAFQAAAPLGVAVKALASSLGVSEAAVRSAIARLNNRGHCICSSGTGIFILLHTVASNK